MSPSTVSSPSTTPCIVYTLPTELRGDYSGFRFRAEVDWIELKITTASPTNFQTVKRRLGVGYAEPIDEGAGGSCSQFKVRFQAPRSWDEVQERLQCLAADHPLACPVTVTGVEIALDAYSRSQNRDELVQMAARFYRSASKLVSENRRASKGKGESHGLETLTQVQQLLADGFNIYVGDTQDPERQHIYLKETDSRESLPLAEHRARIEFTLKDDRVPQASFSEWRKYDFTSFAPYFKFRRLREDPPLLVAAPLQSSAQVGERRPRRTPNGHPRMFSRSTQADRKLNALAFDALRELNRRWCSME